MASKSASTTISQSRLSPVNSCCGSARCFDEPEPRRLAAWRALTVRFGRFAFSLERGELHAGDDPVRITEREREMLRLLSANPGAIVSREALSGSGGVAQERTVDVLVNRLRRKIEQDPANPIYLQTARGAGYRLVADR